MSVVLSVYVTVGLPDLHGRCLCMDFHSPPVLAHGTCLWKVSDPPTRQESWSFAVLGTTGGVFGCGHVLGSGGALGMGRTGGNDGSVIGIILFHVEHMLHRPSRFWKFESACGQVRFYMEKCGLMKTKILALSNLAPIQLEPLRDVIDAVMKSIGSGIFVVSSTPTAVVTGILPANDASDLGSGLANELYLNLQKVASIPVINLQEIPVEKLGSRYFIDGYTTSNLPNNRTSFNSLGQFVEDLVYGRLTESATAQFVIINQNTQKLFVGQVDGSMAIGTNIDSGDFGDMADSVTGSQALLQVELVRQGSVDWFEQAV